MFYIVEVVSPSTRSMRIHSQPFKNSCGQYVINGVVAQSGDCVMLARGQYETFEQAEAAIYATNDSRGYMCCVSKGVDTADFNYQQYAPASDEWLAAKVAQDVTAETSCEDIHELAVQYERDANVLSMTAGYSKASAALLKQRGALREPKPKPLTVAGLIEELKNLPQNLRVMHGEEHYCYGPNYSDITRLSLQVGRLEGGNFDANDGEPNAVVIW